MHVFKKKVETGKKVCYLSQLENDYEVSMFDHDNIMLT